MTVHAGCHHIEKDEVLRFIEVLKQRTPSKELSETA